MVVITLGMTDLLFALDSIPAIYGLTQEPYLVLTANVFALMGLRQLYFLIGGLLQRLVYLSLRAGVPAAVHRREADPPRACTRTRCRSSTAASPSSGPPRSRSGSPSLVILGTLVVTTIASLMSDKSKKDPAKQ